MADEVLSQSEIEALLKAMEPDKKLTRFIATLNVADGYPPEHLCNEGGQSIFESEREVIKAIEYQMKNDCLDPEDVEIVEFEYKPVAKYKVKVSLSIEEEA